MHSDEVTTAGDTNRLHATYRCVIFSKDQTYDPPRLNTTPPGRMESFDNLVQTETLWIYVVRATWNNRKTDTLFKCLWERLYSEQSI